jgi:hypothetical protein
MKNLFSLALIAQIIFSGLFIVHRFFKPLGSDLMFGVLIASLLASGYLLWQSFGNPAIQGAQKTLGIALGFLPIIWVLLLVFFIGNSKM